VSNWFAAARHPVTKRLYTEMAYRPMLELDNSVNDGPDKPVNIQSHIGQRPIFAFGNSDGDLQMLQWTAARSGASFVGLVHTDAEGFLAASIPGNVNA
jgi:hypothetical protein